MASRNEVWKTEGVSTFSQGVLAGRHGIHMKRVNYSLGFSKNPIHCWYQVYVSYLQRGADSTTNTRSTQNHVSYAITCLVRYSSSYLLVLLCTTNKTGGGRTTAGERRRASGVCTQQIQQQQYRTYRSCRTVGALISQNQMIKFDLRTGILFFCPKNARKIPDNTSVQPRTTW